MGRRITRKKVYDSEVVARNVLIDYLGNKCSYCASSFDLQLHHVLPRSKGGEDRMNNIELVCFECHVEIHKRLREAYPHKTNRKDFLDDLLKKQPIYFYKPDSWESNIWRFEKRNK